jgi:hypothetical protein
MVLQGPITQAPHLTSPLPAKRRGEGAEAVLASRRPASLHFRDAGRDAAPTVSSPRLFAGRGRVRGAGDWPRRRSSALTPPEELCRESR